MVWLGPAVRSIRHSWWYSRAGASSRKRGVRLSKPSCVWTTMPSLPQRQRPALSIQPRSCWINNNNDDDRSIDWSVVVWSLVFRLLLGGGGEEGQRGHVSGQKRIDRGGHTHTKRVESNPFLPPLLLSSCAPPAGKQPCVYEKTLRPMLQHKQKRKKSAGPRTLSPAGWIGQSDPPTRLRIYPLSHFPLLLRTIPRLEADWREARRQKEARTCRVSEEHWPAEGQTLDEKKGDRHHTIHVANAHS
jgi:hypothetical protein